MKMWNVGCKGFVAASFALGGFVSVPLLAQEVVQLADPVANNYGFHFDALQSVDDLSTFVGVNSTTLSTGFKVNFWGLPYWASKSGTTPDALACVSTRAQPMVQSTGAKFFGSAPQYTGTTLTETSRQWTPIGSASCMDDNGLGKGYSYVMHQVCPGCTTGEGGLGIFTRTGPLTPDGKPVFWQTYQEWGQPGTGGANKNLQGTFTNFRFNSFNGQEKVIYPFGRFSAPYASYAAEDPAQRSYLVVRLEPEIKAAYVQEQAQAMQQGGFSLIRADKPANAVMPNGAIWLPQVQFKFHIGILRGRNNPGLLYKNSYSIHNLKNTSFAGLMYDRGQGSIPVFDAPVRPAGGTLASRNTCYVERGSSLSLYSTILGGGSRYGDAGTEDIVFRAEKWQFEMTFGQFINALVATARSQGITGDAETREFLIRTYGEGYDIPGNWSLLTAGFSQEVANFNLSQQAWMGGRIKSFEVFQAQWPHAASLSGRMECPATQCQLDGKTILSGQSVSGFLANQVPYGQSCSSQAVTATCKNGQFFDDSGKVLSAFSSSCSAKPQCAQAGSFCYYGKKVQWQCACAAPLAAPWVPQANGCYHLPTQDPCL